MSRRRRWLTDERVPAIQIPLSCGRRDGFVALQSINKLEDHQTWVFSAGATSASQVSSSGIVVVVRFRTGPSAWVPSVWRAKRQSGLQAG
jgi:hypothetical protein